MTSMTSLLPATIALPSAAGSLESYIQAVNRFPLLSHEEEMGFARSYREKEDLDAAGQLVMSHLRLVVSIARGYYHSDHPRLGWFIRNFAFVLSHTKGPERAEPLFEEALRIHRTAYGGDHSDLAHSLEMLGRCRLNLEELTDAAILFQESAEMRKRLSGPDDPATQRTELELQQVRELLRKKVGNK